MLELGRRNHLEVLRHTPQGLYLEAGPEHDGVLLPTRWVTDAMRTGDTVDVFVYRDAEGRPIATTDEPYVAAGGFAFLEVVAVTPGVGVFLDWGLSKDLLVPVSELGPYDLRGIERGDGLAVAVFVDRNDRVVASCRIHRHLADGVPTLAANEAVEAFVWDTSPLGFSAVVNGRYGGLLYRSDTADEPEIGDTLTAYVKRVYDDGKIDLLRDPAGYGRVADLSATILDRLRDAGGRLDVHDKSSPEEIRAAFGCSKKAFKQAVGALYRRRVIRLVPGGIEMSDADAAEDAD